MFAAQFAADWDPPSSSTVWSNPFVKLGGSLTDRTTMSRVAGAEAVRPSLTINSIARVAVDGFSLVLRKVTERNTDWYVATDAAPLMLRTPWLESKFPLIPKDGMKLRKSWPAMKLFATRNIALAAVE